MSVEMYEAFMLICFGSAWPFAIAKSLSSRSAGGKSPLFLAIIFTGYLSGICTHLFGNRSPVMMLYVLNASMVATDLCLVLYYHRFPGGRPKKPERQVRSGVFIKIGTSGSICHDLPPGIEPYKPSIKDRRIFRQYFH